MRILDLHTAQGDLILVTPCPAYAIRAWHRPGMGVLISRAADALPRPSAPAPVDPHPASRPHQQSLATA